MSPARGARGRTARRGAPASPGSPARNRPPSAPADAPVALVTGAAGGLGRAVVARLAAAGVRVVATDLKRPPADVGGALRFALDVRSEASARAARDRVLKSLGRLDVLVNGAGILPSAPLLLLGEAAWRDCVELNLLGVARCVRVFGELMARAGRGRIVTLGSVAGLRGMVGGAAYAASKAAVISLTRSAAVELAPRGVQVTAVLPGVVDAGMTASLSTTQRAQVVAQIPAGRLGRAEEVAEAVAFLALSPAAEYVTGSCLVIDGGLSAA